jgi:ABC-type molybdenum transport system ATPase subunit/photorepair protein PhrA
MPKKPVPAAVEGAEPAIQVTAQQSRFHNDAVDAPTSKEILVKDLTISIGERELLSRTELFLKEGAHYVLVGRNGVGKSSMSQFHSICVVSSHDFFTFVSHSLLRNCSFLPIIFISLDSLDSPRHYSVS